MKAILKNYRQSPRKVRLVANTIRGKSVVDALTTLYGLEKKVSSPMIKLINSAVNNAESKESGELMIRTLIVNEGDTLKRARPRAMSRSAPIKKRSSTISVELQ